MKKALLLGDSVVDVAAEEFPVSPPLRWVDCPDECVANQWHYEDGQFSPIVSADVSVPVPKSITFAQLLIALVKSGWISEEEGEGWLTGTLPQRVLDVIAELPVEQRFAAKARALRPSVIDPSDPLVLSLAAKQQVNADGLRTFFIEASKL